MQDYCYECKKGETVGSVGVYFPCSVHVLLNTHAAFHFPFICLSIASPPRDPHFLVFGSFPVLPAFARLCGFAISVDDFPTPNPQTSYATLNTKSMPLGLTHLY